MTKVAIVMPAYNEESGIAIFLNELRESFKDTQVQFVVVNDCSKDGTLEAVEKLSTSGFPVSIYTNEKNSGHGFSTIAALKHGLATNSDVVIAIDGDGQFNGGDVRKVHDALSPENAIVEGVRTHRNDPLFRRIVSFSTRFLVFTRSRKWPKDANTPLRAYKRETLELILRVVPSETPIPNLYISAFTRKNKIPNIELIVESRSRIGEEVTGTTWGKGLSWLPTKRFVNFTVSATRSWFRNQSDLEK